MGRLEGTVALITGGARGQGEAIARAFVAEGAKVVIGDVLEDEGREVARSLGDAALFVRLDVTSPADWEAAVTAASERFGRLTALVNNAGIHVTAPMDEMTLAEYDRVIAINQTGCWLGMKTAAPAITAAGGGAIVNTSSTAGLIGLAGRSAYVASKFAVRGMSRSAAIELGPSGIRVNSIYPGAIGSSMTGPNTAEHCRRLPVPRIGRTEEVANLVLFLCSEESSYCTGAEFVIDGGSLAGA